MRTGLPLVGTAMLFALLAVVLAPQAGTGCVDPSPETSPDGRWTLSLCPRAAWFAMPGQGGDAPAWIVLRDHTRAMRGLSDLDMVQNYHVAGVAHSMEPRRGRGADGRDTCFATAARIGADWLEERIWRLRALLRLTPTSDMFH